MKRITAILIIIATIAIMAMPVEAGVRYQEQVFEFGGYAPVVQIENAATGWCTQINGDGSFSWKKSSDRVNQLFVILPTEQADVYTIRDFETGLKYITYDPALPGFRMQAAPANKYGMPAPTEYQKFRFRWKKSVNVAGRKVTGCWYFTNVKSGYAFCHNGWAVMKIKQINA